MSTREDVAGLELRIGYTNWRGEYAVRRIRPSTLWFGTTEWHPEAQWFLKARDLDKNKDRDFALKDIGTRPTREDVARLVERLNKAASGIRALSFSEITDADLEAVHYEIRGVADALEATRFSAPAGLSVDAAWQDLCEKDDRTSPADNPEMCLITYNELADYMRRACLSAPAEGLENAKDEGANFVLDTLAKALSLDRWTIHDGSETWDGDVRATLFGILREARVLDPETDELATAALASEKAKRAAAEARNSEDRTYIDDLRFKIDTLSAALKAMGEALRRATDMLSAVAGDIEDGSSLADLRGKYVIALVNCRDDGREALSHYHKHSE